METFTLCSVLLVHSADNICLPPIMCQALLQFLRIKLNERPDPRETYIFLWKVEEINNKCVF